MITESEYCNNNPNTSLLSFLESRTAHNGGAIVHVAPIG